MSAPKHKEIRALYDRKSITVYQAYRPEIAKAAIQAGKFVEPFSFNRMTWIKPSFLWMMERCNWAQKSGQEHVLAITIHREAWEGALQEATLTSPDKKVYTNREQWRRQFKYSRIHVQWDPERSLRGAKLDHRSLQVGVSRHLIQAYNDEWLLSIEDITPLVHKIHRLCREGKHKIAKKQLPQERIYPLPKEIAQKIGST